MNIRPNASLENSLWLEFCELAKQRGLIWPFSGQVNTQAAPPELTQEGCC